MAKIAKKTKRYPSDLTDEEWTQIAPLMPEPGRRGRPREVDFREVINAVRYLVRSGCGWRMLPIHFGPWQTVYGWFRELARRFLFQTIHDVALMVDRERAGREASPSATVIDSQSVKAPQAETRGYDAGKKIVGRKRHIAVDPLTCASPGGEAASVVDLKLVRSKRPARTRRPSFRSKNRTRLNKLLVSLRIRSSHRSSRLDHANFGFGTLGRHRGTTFLINAS